MRAFLLGFTLLVTSGAELCSADTAAHEAALMRAVDFLWSKQQTDGSWRSEYYGVMRSGESLTPLVLSALLQATDSLSSDKAGDVRRAAEFILDHLDEEGALGRSDPDVLEYPVFSTAYAVQSLERAGQYEKAWGPGPQRKFAEATARMQMFLVAAQYQEANGFSAENAAYGGWGFNAPVRPGVVGHMDIAHTRKALGALQTWQDHQQVRQLRDRTLKFLLHMQKHPDAVAPHPHPVNFSKPNATLPFDGGFYFSPVALSANKAPYDEEAGCWPSYASATCDGILALLAADVDREDARFKAAIAWLQRHPQVDYPQGVPTDHPEPWGDAIRFYHYSVRAEVYRRLNFSDEAKGGLVAALCKHQRADGSFVNGASPLMKEDDPLVGTALAVIALTNGLR